MQRGADAGRDVVDRDLDAELLGQDGQGAGHPRRGVDQRHVEIEGDDEHAVDRREGEGRARSPAAVGGLCHNGRLTSIAPLRRVLASTVVACALVVTMALAAPGGGVRRRRHVAASTDLYLVTLAGPGTSGNDGPLDGGGVPRSRPRRPGRHVGGGRRRPSGLPMDHRPQRLRRPAHPGAGSPARAPSPRWSPSSATPYAAWPRPRRAPAWPRPTCRVRVARAS